MHDQESWDEHYAESKSNGRPKAALMSETSLLPKGTALDLGCGEGADAIWLARQGWRVTGMDLSSVALDRAAAHGQGLGIRWLHKDITTWTPDTRFDLVTANYCHPEPGHRDETYRKAAAAVAPGGTLLVLAHHPDDRLGPNGFERPADMLFAPKDITALLDERWSIDVCEARERPAGPHHDGTAIDTVVRATKCTATEVTPDRGGPRFS